MTDFTEQARAKGRVLADEWMQKNGGPQTNGHHIAHTSIIYGFRAGAEWGRAQEPTERALDRAEEVWETAPFGESVRDTLCRALTAARRDEENR